MTHSQIIIVGLGPGDLSHLTLRAWETLSQAPEIYLRTDRHPIVEKLPASVSVVSFDSVYEQGETYEAVYEVICERIIELGRREQGVVYGVPGHPLVAEATVPEIIRRGENLGLSVEVIDGLSFIEPTLALLKIDPFPQTSLVDAFELATAHYPPFPPDAPALIAQIHSSAIASEVKLTLMEGYPDDYGVILVHDAGTDNARVESLKLFEIDRSQHLGMTTSLFVPALPAGSSFESFQDLIAHLRAPDGCPWDREQTHRSLRPFLLEEAYEVLGAIDVEDDQALKEELGDLLLQIVLHVQIASETGEFKMADVLREINDKLVRRHPHVFGGLKIDGKDQVLENWERLKALERYERGAGEEGILNSVDRALPALSQAQSLQRLAATVGFDWPSVSGVIEKTREEIEELIQAKDPSAREAEFGDLLFALVNLARWLEIDAESALRTASFRFRMRFAAIESYAKNLGKELSELSMEEMDRIWNKAKDLDQRSGAE